MAVCEGAKIYTAMSNYSKALNVFLEALKCSIRRYGLEHHNTQAIFSELAVTYELADMPMSLNSWVMSRIKDMPITSMKKHRKR